jgi:lysophospholipase L1-like esterase
MGWGQTIGDYLDGIDVINKAVPGSCTQDFGHMDGIIDNANKGDYVLIFFGHNDQRAEKWVEIDDYKATFEKWIDAIREKQAVPVLITMIPQGKVSTKALYDRDTYKERRKAVIEVASDKEVTLVQLGEQMLQDEANGIITGEDIISMYCDEGGDNRTHITPTGARYVAGIIVNSMKEQLPHFSTFVK